MQLPTEYYYHQGIKKGITYNYAEYYEDNFSSAGLKKLVSILNLNISDCGVVEYVYTLHNLIISEQRVLDIRQKVSKEAFEWYQEKKNYHLTVSNEEACTIPQNDYIALCLDEGKVRIRTSERNPETKKFEFNWKNVKFAVSYPFDSTGEKNGPAIFNGEVKSRLEDFGEDFKALISESGFVFAKKRAVISDGANGYVLFFDRHCPKAHFILDAYHFKEHLWNLAKITYPETKDGRPSDFAYAFVEKYYTLLKIKGYQKFIIELKKHYPEKNKVKQKIWNREINYFENNKDRLDYPTFIQLNLPIGSGVVEGAIKFICNKRFKSNSAAWLLTCVNGLLKLRNIWYNNYFNDFWSWRNSYYESKNYLYA